MKCGVSIKINSRLLSTCMFVHALVCTHARPLSEVEGQELLISSSVFLETLEMAKVLKGC